MSWITFVVFVGLIVVSKYECEAQSKDGRVRVSVTFRDPISEIDPVLTVSCIERFFLTGHNDPIFQWEHNGLVLSRNDVLVDADPSRFSIGDNGRELFIRNAVRDDGGRYTCRVLYRLSPDSQEVMNVSSSQLVPITKYLPPLNYPECSISPDTGVSIGSEITFICVSGESNTPVTLQIRTPCGHPLTSSMVKWTVREEDIMGQFECIMRSDTFPTASRGCSKTIRISTPQSFGPAYTTSDPVYAGNSERSCIPITVLIAPIIISIVSIAAVVFLLLNIYQLKKVISSYETKKANTANKEVGETYMELQKTKTASDEKYTDLNLQRKPEDARQKTVYENSGFEQSSIEETDYANVV